MMGFVKYERRSRWFEVQASRMGAEHFDRKYGSGAKGYIKGSPNYFDKDSFVNGWKKGYLSPYKNPRTGYLRQNSHPITGARFSIWDVVFPVIGPAFTLVFSL